MCNEVNKDLRPATKACSFEGDSECGDSSVTDSECFGGKAVCGVVTDFVCFEAVHEVVTDSVCFDVRSIGFFFLLYIFA